MLRILEKPETAPNGPGNGPDTGLNGGLTPKQEAVALALAVGETIGQAARKGRAGARTVKTWLHDEPALSRRVSELRAEMTRQALGRLVDGMSEAADTLRHLAKKGKSESVRLGAARSIVELGVRLQETVELRERIAELERSLGRGR